MFKKYSLLARNILVVVGLSWLLPMVCHFFLETPFDRPFMLYSPVAQQFTSLFYDGAKIRYTGANGAEYSEMEYDSLHPTIYASQLLADGRFPEEIAGVAMTHQEVRRNTFFFRHQPRDLNKNFIALYPLMESRSKRVNLEMPSDLFRVSGEQIEFVDMKTNQIDSEKSSRFQMVFDRKHFQFPAKGVWGNPTTRKEYDEGYILMDQKGDLFHFKQVVGQPYLKRWTLPMDVKPVVVFVTEYANRKTIAFVIDENSSLYRVSSGDNRWEKLEQVEINPFHESVVIYGNPYVWTIVVGNGSNIQHYAVNDINFNLVDSSSLHKEVTWRDQVDSWIFPFQLSFTDIRDLYVRPRIRFGNFEVFLLNIILIIGCTVYARKKKFMLGIVDTLLLFGLGVFYLPLVIGKFIAAKNTPTNGDK